MLPDSGGETQDKVRARYLKRDLEIIDDIGLEQHPERSGEYLVEITIGAIRGAFHDDEVKPATGRPGQVYRRVSRRRNDQAAGQRRAILIALHRVILITLGRSTLDDSRIRSF